MNEEEDRTNKDDNNKMHAICRSIYIKSKSTILKGYGVWVSVIDADSLP